MYWYEAAKRYTLPIACVAVIGFVKSDMPFGWGVETTALFILCVLATLALLRLLAGDKFPSARRVFLLGLILGGIAGALGGYGYAVPGIPEGGGDVEAAAEANGLIPRYVRVIVISSYIGGLLNLILHTLLDVRIRRASSFSQRDVTVISSLGLLATATMYAVGDTESVGSAVNFATRSMVDWIGTGVCSGREDVGCVRKLRNITAPQLALILAIFCMLCASWYAYRVRLRPSTFIVAIAGIVFVLLMSLIIFPRVFSYLPSRLIRTDPLTVSIWTICWTGFVYVLFRVILWMRQRSVIEALEDAYREPRAFDEMLNARLPDKLVVPPTRKAETLASRAVEAADREGWLMDLVVNARYSRPASLGLARVADEMEVGVQLPQPEGVDKIASHFSLPKLLRWRFQRVIGRDDIGLGDPWRKKMASLEPCVCRVEINYVASGTGFLVGPDLVLTAYHVLFSSDDDERKRAEILRKTTCRFDYVERDERIFSGTLYRLSQQNPCVAFEPPSLADLNEALGDPSVLESDFILLRLDKSAGKEPLGGASAPDPLRDSAGMPETGAPVRGWISYACNNALSRDDLQSELVWVLQHPKSGVLKQSIGRVLSVIRSGVRINHDADTEDGSSGAPCFSLHTMQLIGMHQATATVPDPPGQRRRPINRAIGILAVATLSRHLAGIAPCQD